MAELMALDKDSRERESTYRDLLVACTFACVYNFLCFDFDFDSVFTRA